MRVASFVDSFPVVSETFVLHQIIGLLDLGHEVDIYAARTPAQQDVVHAEVARYALPARTTYIDQHMPVESGIWEAPVWPLTGRTWLPGGQPSVSNATRVLRALPTVARCLMVAPRTTVDVLNSEQYGYQARSLSAMYRLSALCRRGARIGRRMRRPYYDVLHAHFGPTAVTFRFARQLWDAPLIVSFHGYDYTSVPRQQGATTYHRLFRSVDAVIANSDYARAALEKLGCPSTKLHRLNYGIDLSSFTFRERQLAAGETIRVLTVARLVEKKGLFASIRAFAAARRQYPNARYEIIGDGPLEQALAELIVELGESDTITLRGAVDAAAVRDAMMRAHIFVLASMTATDGDQEGTPVSILEAHASGLPVLSSRHSGIPEIVVEGESGFLVREGDVAMLADRLVQLFDHPDNWARLGRKGRAFVEERHDHRRLNLQLIDLYERVRSSYATRSE